MLASVMGMISETVVLRIIEKVMKIELEVGINELKCYSLGA